MASYVFECHQVWRIQDVWTKIRVNGLRAQSKTNKTWQNYLLTCFNFHACMSCGVKYVWTKIFLEAVHTQLVSGAWEDWCVQKYFYRHHIATDWWLVAPGQLANPQLIIAKQAQLAVRCFGLSWAVIIATIRQLASSADILPSLEKGEMLDFCFGLATPRKGVLHLERVKRTLDRVAMLRSLCKA